MSVDRTSPTARMRAARARFARRAAGRPEYTVVVVERLERLEAMRVARAVRAQNRRDALIAGVLIAAVLALGLCR